MRTPLDTLWSCRPAAPPAAPSRRHQATAPAPEVDEPRSSDATPAWIGRVLSERYRIEALLGGGAMGQVYRARHLLMKRTGSIRVSRVHVIWICQLMAVLFFTPLLFQVSSTTAMICLSLAIGFSMMPNSLYYSICTDLSHDHAGAATGIMITFFSVSGIVSPLLTGWLSDVFGGFGAAFGALVFFVSTAVLGMVIFAHPDSKRT